MVAIGAGAVTLQVITRFVPVAGTVSGIPGPIGGCPRRTGTLPLVPEWTAAVGTTPVTWTVVERLLLIVNVTVACCWGDVMLDGLTAMVAVIAT